ncbi:phosphohistidine phosphatase SixA [Ferrimonas lipolytica]|uniref:Phosphohistidine phosphatase SixA n=1 Tax=Ferrimonas lipolytica TaxID=2724191 RepID=A0A6H1UF11_9GAMM|nr:phosphohistidine phosphatase SixA [Ferrimonas lipolytica]QIZ77219.1 phosphohistidine phosphatase SixA [Ferrimonas lipolytica]
MNIYLMRHGEAGFDAPSDQLRQLTSLGKSQSLEVAQQFLVAMQHMDLVLVSPYLRAQQTWQMIESLCQAQPQVQVLDELVPEADPAITRDVVVATAAVAKANNVLVIAHMPLLGYLLAELVPGQEPCLFATSGIAEIAMLEKPQLERRASPQMHF